MPVYEYLCVQCGNRFDKLVPIARNGSPTLCPDCGGRAVKQFSPVAVLGIQRVAAGGGGGCCGGGGGCACAG